MRVLAPRRNSRECERAPAFSPLEVTPSRREAAGRRAGFGMERRRRRTRAADDPESRLWTFTNASTLPAGVTTRVCTGGRACPSRSPAPAPLSCRSPPRFQPSASRPAPLSRRALSIPRLHRAPRRSPPPSSSPFHPPSRRRRLLHLLFTVLRSSLR